MLSKKYILNGNNYIETHLMGLKTLEAYLLI